MVKQFSLGIILLLLVGPVVGDTVTVEVHVTFVDVAATSEDPLNTPINPRAEPSRPVTVTTEETESVVEVTVVYQ